MDTFAERSDARWRVFVLVVFVSPVFLILTLYAGVGLPELLIPNGTEGFPISERDEAKLVAGIADANFLGTSDTPFVTAIRVTDAYACPTGTDLPAAGEVRLFSILGIPRGTGTISCGGTISW